MLYQRKNNASGRPGNSGLSTFRRFGTGPSNHFTMFGKWTVSPAASAHSSLGRPRSLFVSARRFFPSMRLRLLPFEGFVAIRGLGAMTAAATRSRSRSIAASRFADWLREPDSVRIRSSSAVTRRPARRRSRSSASSDIGRSRSDSRSSIFVLTLLTFCPPGPDARTAENRRADAGTRTRGVNATRFPGGSSCGKGGSSGVTPETVLCRLHQRDAR